MAQTTVRARGQPDSNGVNSATHSRKKCNPRWQALLQAPLSRLRWDIFPGHRELSQPARDDATRDVYILQKEYLIAISVIVSLW